MPFLTRCPNCRRDVSVPTASRGSWVRCPSCPARFVAQPEEAASLAELAVTTGPRPPADARRMVEDPLPPRRPPAPGDLRRRARRCRSCEGHVPGGMSICPVCGFDQESEQWVAGRIRVIEPEAPEASPAPLGLRVVGWSAIGIGIATATVSALRFDLVGWWLLPFLAALAWLGIYGGIQLLRGFRVRPLAMGLTLAAVLDIALAFVLPVIASRSAGGALDAAMAGRMVAGAAVLAVLTLAAVYLGTTAPRRFFAERRPHFAEPGDEDEWLGGYTTTI